MKKLNKAIAGNRYEVTVCDDGKMFVLFDATLQKVVAISDNADELIIYAQRETMINADAVIIR